MKKVIIVICLLVGLLLGCLLIRVCARAKQPPFAVLTRPIEMPVLMRDRVERRIPATSTWAWARHIEQWMLGPRKLILLESQIFSLADVSAQTYTNLALGNANFSDASGLKIWLLPTNELKALSTRLKQMPGTELLNRPRVSTAEGIAAQMTSGSSVQLNGSRLQVGMALGCFANVHKDSTDLIAEITTSELVTNAVAALGGSFSSNNVSIQTNLDTAVRVQIPNGSGIFLIDESPASRGRKCTGVIMELARLKK